MRASRPALSGTFWGDRFGAGFGAAGIAFAAGFLPRFFGSWITGAFLLTPLFGTGADGNGASQFRR
jgi:hypothetical protein